MARKTKAALAAEAAAKAVQVGSKIECSKEFEDKAKIEYVVAGTLKYVGDSVSMIVKMAHIDSEIPFSAHHEDPMEHGQWLYNEAIAGTFGDIAPYERPLPTAGDLQMELDKLMTDITLGLATPEELDLARNLRKQIKVMMAE
ncbi:hypothetical protein uav_091 [Pseudomonas phage UAVern]|uniref:Uncharacterized protein n=1 Tax=Pseudomonas phage UAVern TaxID=2856997 RepID=A0A975UWC1_9CAUD|nr:hypothetical protein uav_091 [Pseudomonas phage UAVern]